MVPDFLKGEIFFKKFCVEKRIFAAFVVYSYRTTYKIDGEV